MHPCNVMGGAASGIVEYEISCNVNSGTVSEAEHRVIIPQDKYPSHID